MSGQAVRLFDLDAAREARDEAIERVDEHADPAWKEAAYAVVCAIAAEVPEFTTDRVWYALERQRIPAPREPRALGPVMQRARRAGLIVNTRRMQQSRSVVNHGRLVAVWKSEVCE
jgi:hypothetical protein